MGDHGFSVHLNKPVYVYSVGNQWTMMNFHNMLSHLCMCIKDWGPLWAYSCFAYEGMNKELKALFCGTRNMSKQVMLNFFDAIT